MMQRGHCTTRLVVGLWVMAATACGNESVNVLAPRDVSVETDSSDDSFDVSIEASVDISVDVYHAFTKTDVVGRFYLCRINSPIRIDVGMTGYQWESRYLRGASADLEIELRRN